MNRKEKEKIVKELETKFGKSVSSVFAEFRGLNVERMEELRKRFREAEIEFRVIKNTLAKRACKSLNLEVGESFFIDSTAVAFGWDDPITPIKVMSDFAKENIELVLKGGIIEGTVISKDKICAFANLPSRDILLSQLLMGMQSPVRGFINVLSGPIRGFINCLKAIEQKKS